MTIDIIDWDHEMLYANTDKNVGIKIAILCEIDDRGTYLTILDPGVAITPHYHEEGSEEYHIINGAGVIRLLPADALNKDVKLTCKHVQAKTSFVIPPRVIHQLINIGTEPLTLIFSCPRAHLQEDRIIIDLNEAFYQQTADFD